MEDTDLRNSLIALHSANFAWAVTCCRSRELAEEVLQGVYVKVLDGGAGFRGQASLKTWLFTVIRNAARDHQRVRWRSRFQSLEMQTLAVLPDASQLPPEDSDEEIALIRQALTRLPERQRQVVHLVFYDSLTLLEAAEVLEVSVGSVRQHYARAKQTLRSALKTFRNGADGTFV